MENLKGKGLAIQAMQHVDKKIEQASARGYALELNGEMQKVNLHHGYAASKEGRDVMAEIHKMGMKG